MRNAERITELGDWYHRIELSDGTTTPGDRDQSLTYALYEPYLPPDLRGLTVLDLGANAGGLTIEFARRGANVVMVELGHRYLQQAEFVLNDLGLRDSVEIHRMDVYGALRFGRRFDVVCYVGLSYHLRYPQLALDMLTHVCGGSLLASTQTIPGSDLLMANRAARVRERELGHLYGWEPTEQAFLEMMAHAGFRNPRLVSTAPHAGEREGRYCGNRSYFVAEGTSAHPLPFVDESFVGKPELRQ